MNKANPVMVPMQVYQGIQAVRNSGFTNMFDAPVVQQLARIMGFPETAEWIQQNRRIYFEGILRGLAPMAEGGES